MAAPRAARPIDHCVLPVGDIETARARYVSLGFTVAPDGSHPFGTENCCVYFSDNTFLEPLAIGHRETAEKAAVKGNAFVARDAAYRFRRGEEGFSALVMGSDDADADHAAFVRNAISGGRKLVFSRQFVDASGNKGKATFKLAFAADLRAPDAFFFTCERVGVPKVDRSALQRHDNGVVRIRSVVMTEPNPTDFQYPLQEVVNQREVQAHSFGMDIEASNGTVQVLNGAGYEAFFGLKAASHARGLRLRAIVFGVRDLEATRKELEKAGPVRVVGKRLIVDPAPGQGAVLAFEAEQ